MKRILRILLTVVILSVIAIVVIQVVQAQQAGQATEPAPGVQVLDEALVELADLTVTVSGTGSVKPNREVELVFEASAPVAEVLVEEGQHVKAGDVLARLDTSEISEAVEDAQTALEQQRVAYDALVADPREVDIEAAQAAVYAAQAAASAALQGADDQAIEIARVQSELSRNQLWQTQLERDQTFELGREFRGGVTGAFTQEIQITSGVTSAEYGVEVADANYMAFVNEGPDQAALGSANAQLVQAQVALENLLNGPDETDLRRAELALQSAELAIAQAQAAVDKAALVAPFDGVIAINNLVVGEVPPAEQAAVLLLDDSSYYLDLSIDETDIADVHTDQTVELVFDALEGEDISGQVTRVAVTPTREGQLVTYTVRVQLNDTDAPVRAGMSATATVIVNQLSDVLVVPNRFVRIDRATGQTFVTVQQDTGQFEEVQVELGVRNETQSQIVSGLQEGQRVVLLPRDTFNPFGG